MKIELPLMLIVLVLYARSEDYQVQDYIMKDNIIILHPRIFHDIVDQFPNGLLVKFFSPYCPKSAEFRVEYIEIAQRIKETGLDVAVAELDGNEYQDICDEYKVQGFPAVLLFKNGNYLEYQGVRTEDKIYSWVVKKVNYKMKGFNELQKLNQFIKTQSNTALYYGDQANPKFKIFISVCQNLDEVTCVYVQSQEIAAQFSLEPNNIIIFKNYGQDKEIYKGKWDESDLWSWCQFKSVIPMTQCDQYIISNIFIYGFPAIVLLKNKDDSNSLEILRSAAPSFQSYAIITYANFDDE